ncbi:testis-expressed protein 22 [Delphinus delphis]|uniref:testis-expressed protein 22 n=1 Tax=Delphinus delphis TaxID=9728 RepID=UPI0028C42CEC|nr:testis-expressed protein 22 [Delphinus delphis]
MEWRGAGCRLLRRLHAWSCGRGAQSLDLGVWPGGVEVAVGTYPQSPRGAGEPPKGLEMDSGKRLFKAFLGKMPESQPSQENGQPSAPPSPAVAWGQPGAPSSSQQVLQTQDWVGRNGHFCNVAKGSIKSARWMCFLKRQAAGTASPSLLHVILFLFHRYIGSRRTTVTGGGGRLPSAPCNSPLSSEFLLPRTFPSCKPEAAPRPRPALAASIPCSDSTDLMTLGVRDAGEQAPSRRWHVSIDERWRLAVLGGGERPGLAGATLSYRDLAQIVAQLVSQDEDKGVLLPHPPRSAESSSAFQAFLVRSTPFWHNVTLEAQASRSPPS